MGARGLYRTAMADLDMIRERDPSILSRTEALLHPAVVAIWGYRVAHRTHLRGLRRTARLMSTVARVVSGGIEIHPGARIGRRFLIDHGTGVVIGETAVIGDDVTIFHQVTLGSVGWWHDQGRPEGTRRHPEVGDRVVIGANATLLGAITVGPDAVIGAQALVIRDVASGARVLAPIAEPRPRRTHRTQNHRRRAPVAADRARRDHDNTSVTFPTW
ncbi:serine O-acetyltransferase EpsC [Streptomyces clavuligerus]|uniref:Serine acetyltransferase n=1 Tax=Streptomyces clavuligerus TaxID=1901 RepID=D5SM15_STRCL|nr:serine O-acetyltransferase EpsC [Streptomyces clavuligerus]EFG04958.1 serine O-acetyltransferase [Streptomyces clavuligerus]MBY6306612.1 serine acetyltransferase [Streptomyces clavuligerus]QCS10782.1 serine acetyltransferase [Streptomyces clavuligerus]QPJ98417.1 serine acetyltransferase [Streptomyces clavuligerus]WDN57639.1 serine acetyltransferase [Streptomyces clavuligerus]